MNRGMMIGRGMARSVGQVAVSVVATLIATQIYAGLQRPTGDGPARPAVSLTPGGKYDARVAGAAQPPEAEPARPLPSVVSWGIAPLDPTRLLEDVAWGPVEAGLAGVAEPPARPSRHDGRRSVAPAAAARPASFPQLDLHTAPGPGTTEPTTGVWPIATAVVQTVAGLGGTALAIGSAAVGHLNPWSR